MEENAVETSTAAVAVTVTPALSPRTIAVAAGATLVVAAVTYGVMRWKKSREVTDDNATVELVDADHNLKAEPTK